MGYAPAAATNGCWRPGAADTEAMAINTRAVKAEEFKQPSYIMPLFAAVLR